MDKPESRIFDDAVKPDKDNSEGVFSGLCEFCLEPIKPFPTLEQQLKVTYHSVLVFGGRVVMEGRNYSYKKPNE